jgi:predicted transposase/invertase (TIGR01784 family)
MKPLLSPKTDFVFKKLFVSDTGILTDLLNAVMKLPRSRRIRSVEVKNPTILPEEITKKFIILDILATDESGQQYEIEMQVRRHEAYLKRSLYYVSRLYAGQLDSGEDCGELCPVVGIHFLDYEEFSDYDDFHFCFRLRDALHSELVLTDDMTLHIFELPKFEKLMKSGQINDAMSEWLRFFNHAHEEEDKTMRTGYKNPAIHKAFGILESLSADDESRYLAEMREKALKTERTELGAAERRGILKGEIRTAENLLKMGILTTEQIAQATGLPKKEILKIRKSLDKHLIS